MMCHVRRVAFFLLILTTPARAHAEAVLLLGEPYGRFGSLNPTGHAAVYLTRICAESPTILRRCQAGETGIVISRYHRVGGVDWVAMPLLPYLYAVNHAAEVPSFADPQQVRALRETYRRANLKALIPSTSTGEPPKGDWIQLLGTVYDRKVVAFSVHTTPSQDDEVIRELNSRENRPRFNLLFRNCADFARDVLQPLLPEGLTQQRYRRCGTYDPQTNRQVTGTPSGETARHGTIGVRYPSDPGESPRQPPDTRGA
jgi:hypothetical protein